jgi:peptidoglycan/LPS O-acetylase OafA/YrhL
VGITAFGLLVASPPVALVAGVATLALARWPRARVVILVLSPAALALSRFDQRPQLAWLAVALTVTVVATDAVRPVSPEPG